LALANLRQTGAVKKDTEARIHPFEAVQHIIFHRFYALGISGQFKRSGIIHSSASHPSNPVSPALVQISSRRSYHGAKIHH
jgi:hypothetical protein